MKILISSQYFWPESFRINELAISLLMRGIDVTVVTGKPNYPEGHVYPGYKAFSCTMENWKGVEIYRVPIVPRGKKRSLGLILNYISFILSCAVLGPWMLRKKAFDIVFVYGTSPLLQALPAIFIAKLKGVPLILNVQDLWPESLHATGYVRNRLLIAIVDIFVKFIYRQVDLILISSRPFQQSIESYNSSAKIIYFPNSVDSSFCNPQIDKVLDVPGLDKGFSIVFAGNLGSAQALDVIISAAEMVKHNDEIRFIIFGSGSELEWMSNQIIQKQLSNIYLAGKYPVETMPNLLSRASALLVTLADKEIFAATVPNKIQAYMAVGRPIIASLNGEGARLVEDSGGGIAVPAEDANALVEAILELKCMSPQDRDRMGSKAKEYYRQNFDHEILVSELISHISNIRDSEK